MMSSGGWLTTAYSFPSYIALSIHLTHTQASILCMPLVHYVNTHLPSTAKYMSPAYRSTGAATLELLSSVSGRLELDGVSGSDPSILSPSALARELTAC